MTAKQELFTRLQHLTAAVLLPELIDQGVAINAHNGRANLLRKGLGIIAFNILEDFIKNRSAEALSFVSQCGTEFRFLPKSLQEASTFGALDALASRARLERRAGRDAVAYIQTEALKINSTGRSPFELSGLSLASSGSNVTSDDIATILRAFGVSGGWETLKRVSDKIGGGITDLNQCYKNAAERRHGAAHSANFTYSHQWLLDIRNEIIAISASLDIAISSRCRDLQNQLLAQMREIDVSTDLKIRFLELQNSGPLRETTVIGGRSRKNWSSLPEALNALQPMLVRNDEYLVMIGTDRRIADWLVR